MKMVRYLLLTLSVLVMSAIPCFAALDLTDVEVDTTPVFALATIVVVAIAGIWGIKKVIKLGNRS